MDCIFCKIIRRELPNEVVHEDDVAIAIVDIHPRSPGHVFVLPKHHVSNIGEVRDADISALFVAVRNVAALVKRAMNPDGLTIGINEGQAGGQEIDHLHIHIMPRFEGDGGGSVQSIVNNVPKESVAEIAAKIRNAKE